MSTQFDACAARRVEAIYLTPDVVRQRREILDALALASGERVADLGSGPGLLAQDMLGRVGAQGSVEGVDLSADMVALAQQRCAAAANARFRTGDVARLPYEDARFDVAVCTQVYEYVEDVDAALRELHRVLRPGGRAVVVDTDWASCVWNASDAERMRRMLETWDRHCPHPQLPRTLRRRLEQAGLQVDSCGAIVLLNDRLDPDTYSHAMMGVIGAYAGKRLGADMAAAWREDLAALGARDEYFFSLNRYLFRVRRPR
ncbi:MAG: methyltransferase domain-containing protein [Burkholderiales bacterium]|nr:methyltransferase domain-containing protein [Burkholderiales bacterium]